MIRLEAAFAITVVLSLTLTFSNVASDSGSSNDPYVHVQFVNSSTGWIFGSRLWQTTDGGKNWKVIHDGENGTVRSHTVVYDLHRFQFINPTVGVNWRGNTFTRTSDGGRTWEERFSIPPENEYQLLSFFFLSPTEGWAIGKTVHYGQRWTELAGIRQDTYRRLPASARASD